MLYKHSLRKHTASELILGVCETLEYVQCQIISIQFQYILTHVRVERQNLVSSKKIVEMSLNFFVCWLRVLEFSPSGVHFFQFMFI